MKLSIIIVSYNTKFLTAQAVDAAWKDAQRSPLLKNKTEVIVVDNNSNDGSLAELREEFNFKQLRLVQNKENLGFARANNQAIKMATGEYILLLNSDTIVQQGALEKLVQAFEDYPIDDSTSTLYSQQGRIDRLGMVAATLLNEDGTVQPQGGNTPTLGALACHMLLLDDLPLIGRFLPSTQHTGFRQTERLRYQTKDSRLISRGWVAATAVMLRREMLDEIGLLDENIFMYGEDVEFCLRARHHHWDIAIHPQAKVTHLGSASSSSQTAIKGELLSYAYIWSKHKPLWQVPVVKALLKIGAGLRVFVFTVLRRDPKRATTYQQAWNEL